jgi:competence protein ComEC
VQWTAALPGASLEIYNYDFTALLLTYVLIAAVAWRSPLHDWLGRARQWLGEQWQHHVWSTSGLGVLGIGCILIWFGLASQPDGRLHLYFLNIGQGDGILIQTPSGRQVLIDGGTSPQQLFSELGATMPFWDRSLDLVIVTHPDADHIAAQVELPSRFQITTALESNASSENPNAEAWRAALRASDTEIQTQYQGGWIDLGDNVGLQILWPPIEPFGQGLAGSEQFFDNENSLVIQLVYGEFRVLLTGDIGIPAENELLAAGMPLASTVLKAGHHGSKGSTGEDFVQAVNPQLVIIQAGVDNDYGHPHGEVLERLAGRQILRNDQHGRIHLYSDGMTVGIETEYASR